MQFEKIYSENYKIIYNVVKKMVPNDDDAADIVQDVFVNLYQMLKKGSTVEFPRSWLYKVSVNKCIDFCIKQKKHEKIESANSLKYDETPIETTEKQAVVRLALSRLKKNESVLAILYSEGLSYKEISEITGIKFASVGKTLSRTLLKLENELRKLHYEMY